MVDEVRCSAESFAIGTRASTRSGASLASLVAGLFSPAAVLGRLECLPSCVLDVAVGRDGKSTDGAGDERHGWTLASTALLDEVAARPLISLSASSSGELLAERRASVACA